MNINTILETSTDIPNFGNNKIKRFTNDKYDLIIKFFNNDNSIKQEREVYFIEYLSDNGVTCIPKLFAYSFEKKYTIFHFIDGSSSKTELDLSAILPFANFINLINNKLDHKNYKYNAIDSAYSDKEHFHNVYQRLSLYIEFAKKNNDLDYEEKIFNNCKIFLDKYFDENKPLSSSKNEIILSPSDFGIHNSIFNNNMYYFIDFEFAGLDDPAKLICDFMLHPKNNLKKESMRLFTDNLFFYSKSISKRIELLFPIYIIKWILIILNFVDNENLKKKKKLIADFNNNDFIDKQRKKIPRLTNILKNF
jgi:hypothetical protein